MATDYGTDVSCVDDLDPTFALVRGSTAVAQALARRFITARGGLHYDGTYGYDLRNHLNASLDAGDEFLIASAVEAQCEQDERVRSASARVTYVAATETLRVAIVAEGDAGPFELVLGVSAVTIEILSIRSLS